MTTIRHPIITSRVGQSDEGYKNQMLRCSPVVRAFTHSAMGRGIDPSRCFF